VKGIYQIRNIENGKKYVGSSKDLEMRWEKHRQKLNADNHYNPYLQNAWNKYGQENFNFEILESSINNENLKTKEKNYIKEFKTCDEENGYNIQKDPQGGDTLTGHPNYDELMEKWSEKNSGKKNGFYGETHEKETIEFLRELSKGKNNPMYNKSHDKEAIEKMKEAAEGRYTLEWFKDRYGEEEGRKRYKERSERISSRVQEDNPMDKEEYRNKVAESLKGKEKSEEHKKNISEARKGKVTGKDNPNYVHVPKNKLKEKIQEGLVSTELADYFDTSQNTITKKVNQYWGEGLRQVRKQVS